MDSARNALGAYGKLRSDEAERRRLVAEHLDAARRIALRVARRVPSWILPEDLISAATIGLAEAAERYDTSRGEPFLGFAERRIRGAVLDELRRGDLLSRRSRQAERKVAKTLRALEHQLGRPPEDEEVAKALGVSLEEYREELEHLTHIGFDELGTGASPDPMATDPSPEREAGRRLAVDRLEKALGILPEREAVILNLYYVEELSYSEIGKLLGVTESRICQVHGRAMVKLREEMGLKSEDLGGGG